MGARVRGRCANAEPIGRKRVHAGAPALDKLAPPSRCRGCPTLPGNRAADYLVAS